MAAQRGCITLQVVLFLIICSSSASTGFGSTNDTLPHFSRSSFPQGFVFGAASSAYQYEGAASEGGRGPSIWDTYTHKFPDKIADRSNADVADNFYHLYKEDVKLIKHLGLNAFRMSISWSRILPRGKLSGGVNKEGIAFYNNVFNELLANGIIPFVTLFHWDLPQALEDEYLGFLSPRIVDDFKDFAELCFKEFGDHVKYWVTINEPFTYSNGGYDGGFIGNLAPGRCSNRANCAQGNSATEPYIVAHHLLLAHAAAARLYKDKYQPIQKGEIGIVLVTHWMVPYSSNRLDVRAARRALDFMYGWFINPLVYGEYPRTMQSLVGNRLPKFTKEQAAMLKGSFDYLGLNYYTANYAAHILSRTGNISSTTDNMVRLSTEINGVPIGKPTGVSSFFIYPKGLHDLLLYTKERYNNPTIYITETGMGDANNGTIKHAIEDPLRVDFYNGHLRAVHQAIQQGVNVKGFFAWSFLDTFEWVSGYTHQFGICYVDFKNKLKRIPKRSAIWIKNFLNAK
ncbi:beta-glucosidase 12-like isoform X2 [Sesamum indicum]|uniref:Beta-glucosidase 12-like isoform X2 n=1 Tax=Sesamum indicum TaxID=4182 RepID=A0A8M8V5B8_SESIN|nr:beta-glucosidase 12-like isoform X2 [Sesamum indicum]